jgi:hypothetical protein
MGWDTIYLYRMSEELWVLVILVHIYSLFNAWVNTFWKYGKKKICPSFSDVNSREIAGAQHKKLELHESESYSVMVSTQQKV